MPNMGDSLGYYHQIMVSVTNTARHSVDIQFQKHFPYQHRNSKKREENNNNLSHIAFQYLT